MQSPLQNIRTVAHSMLDMWKKDTSSLDFVWLARFRFLVIYSVIKFVLVIIAGIIGMKLHELLPPSTRQSLLLLWISICLAIVASVILLVLGLGLASRFRLTRSTGIVLLGTTDVCLLLAVMNASMFESKIPLLIALGLISCTTILFVERISRYARRFTFRSYELAEAQYEHDMLLLQHTHELAQAIEEERLSLKRELHDGLLQELSALLLQVSIIMMRNSADGRLTLNADEAQKMKAALDRAVIEARKTIHDLNTSSPAQETQSV